PSLPCARQQPRVDRPAPGDGDHGDAEPGAGALVLRRRPSAVVARPATAFRTGQCPWPVANTRAAARGRAFLLADQGRPALSPLDRLFGYAGRKRRRGACTGRSSAVHARLPALKTAVCRPL